MLQKEISVKNQRDEELDLLVPPINLKASRQERFHESVLTCHEESRGARQGTCLASPAQQETEQD